MSDITGKEFKKIFLPFYNNVNDYLNKYIYLSITMLMII